MRIHLRFAALTTAAGSLVALAFATPTIQAQGKIELNMGSLAPKGTPWMDLLEDVESIVEKESGDRINVIIRPPGVMGEVEMVRETRKGERLQGAAVTTAAIAEGGNIPQLSIVELPFLFDTDAEADHVLDKVLWGPYSEILQKRGFKLGVWSENGWRSFATRGEPIRTPQDVKKHKMRSQESDVHVAMYKAFDTNPIQKPMTEVYTSLQSKVIDGLDNTALYIQAGGLAEPLDTFTLSRHIYQPAAVVFSKRWFDDLPADLQAVVMKPRSLAAGGRAAIRAEDKLMIEQFELFNVEVVELSPSEREAFATVARGIHDDYASTVTGGPELLTMIRDALSAHRK